MGNILELLWCKYETKWDWRLTRGTEVSCCVIDGDSSFFALTFERCLVPQSVVDTSHGGLDLDPAWPQVQVEVDVTVQQFKGEEVGLRIVDTLSEQAGVKESQHHTIKSVQDEFWLFF